MSKTFKNNDVYGPIATDLIGRQVWTEGSGWVVIRAMFFQSVTGFTFLTEDSEGQLFEHNYSEVYTMEPND